MVRDEGKRCWKIESFGGVDNWKVVLWLKCHFLGFERGKEGTGEERRKELGNGLHHTMYWDVNFGNCPPTTCAKKINSKIS